MENYILNLQENKCANNPNKPALNLSDYNCLLWINNNGYFDYSGYVIGYIDEYNLSHNNSIKNIQALCPNCHAVKVKKFNKQNKHFTTSQLAIGIQYMDID